MYITILSAASCNGHLEAARLLLDRGADPNRLCSRGQTPLMWAVCEAHTAVAELLLERGAAVNAETSGGWTAFHHACDTNSADCAALLVRAGCDVEAKTKGHRTFKVTGRQIAEVKNHAAVLDVLSALAKRDKKNRKRREQRKRARRSQAAQSQADDARRQLSRSQAAEPGQQDSEASVAQEPELEHQPLPAAQLNPGLSRDAPVQKVMFECDAAVMADPGTKEKYIAEMVRKLAAEMGVDLGVGEYVIKCRYSSERAQ